MAAAILVRHAPEPKNKPPWAYESLPALPLWFWTTLIGLALAVRLYKLTDLPVWPTTDEGASAFFATQLNHQWHWNLFFGISHLPPGFYWLLALFFKIIPPSLFSLWLFPALISMGTLTMGYLASRHFFSKSFSTLMALFWSFCFWPLYLGRFNISPILIPFWECFCLLLLGHYLHARSFELKIRRGLCLSLGLGLGFYINLHWPLIAFMIGIAYLCSLRSIKKTGQQIFLFLIGFLPIFLLLIPLIIQYVNLPTNTYLESLWVFKNNISLIHYLQIAGSYLTALFWGIDPEIHEFGYRPLWGGFLNPLMDTLFFLGLIELVQQRRHPWVRWIMGAFLLFLLPGFLTSNFEIFRILPVLPLLLFCVALGFQVLLIRLPGEKTVYFLGMICLCSFGIDFFHLSWIYPNFWKSHPEKWEQYAKQRQCYDAYQILKQIQVTREPGLVLNEFTTCLGKDPKEQSLTVACFPFDAQRNSSLGFEKARWAAVLVETPDVLFLSQRFPKSKWFELGPSLYPNAPPHRYWMMVTSLTNQNTETFQRWSIANLFLQDLFYESLNPVNLHFREDMNYRLFENHKLFKSDLFLESHFWKVVVDNLMSAGQPESRILSAVQWGLKKGYPSAENYHFLGNLFFASGKYHEARRSYEIAGRLDPFFRPPKETLEKLDRLEQNQLKKIHVQ